MKGKTLKILGLLAAVVGIGLNLANDWLDNKKMEEAVEEKINEEFAKRDES